MFMQEEDTNKLKALAEISEKTDVNTLKAIADIANADDLPNILATAKRLNDERREKERQFNFKYTIGKIIEDEIRRAVSDELSCNYSASDVQNGQDMIISYKEKPVYYLECKAKWSFAEPAHMSSQQMKKSVREMGHYALCCVDCTPDTGARIAMDASIDDVMAAHDSILANTYVHTNIGELLAPTISPIIKEEEQTLFDDSNIRVRGELSSYIPKRVFVKGRPFRIFMDDLNVKLREIISEDLPY